MMKNKSERKGLIWLTPGTSLKEVRAGTQNRAGTEAGKGGELLGGLLLLA